MSEDRIILRNGEITLTDDECSAPSLRGIERSKVTCHVTIDELIKAAERRGAERMLKIIKGFKIGMSISLLETYPPDQLATIEEFIWKAFENENSKNPSADTDGQTMTTSFIKK